MKLISNEPLQNAPPSLAFATVAMGAFRGLVVDILWIRADRLKEQGQFFDARQIAEWITTLQPRFASVWDFHSWNMAYNISVAIPASQPDQRWRWVKNGYELLRDKGIPLNPRSILLYRQLALIFQHKLGGLTDEAHEYYKLQLAMAMEPLLGRATNEYFEALAKAPTEWEQVGNDPNIVPLIEALKSADEAFADAGPHEFVNNYLSLRQNPSRFSPGAFRTIDNFRGSGTLEKFDVFAKAYHLLNTWKLEPPLMQELNRTYGPIDWDDPNAHLPLDWRHPDSHAIYWAVKGLRVAGKKGVETPGEDQYSADEINTDRIVAHSLQNLFRYGKIFVYNVPQEEISDSSSQPGKLLKKEIFLRPDLEMFEPYNKAIMMIIEKYTQPNEGGYTSHQIGHRNMMKNAVLAFYQAGHKRQAQSIYGRLRQLYPVDEFEKPLAVFARDRFIEELKTLQITDAREIIEMLLREAYFRYAMHDDDETFSREKLAEEVYDFYNRIYTDEERIDLPPFPLLRYLALLDFLDDQQYALGLRLSLIRRIKIERPELAEELQLQEENLRKKLEQQR